MRANLKRHNRVYILSSKQTYRPMRARVVAQLFYNSSYVETDVDVLDSERILKQKDRQTMTGRSCNRILPASFVFR